MPGNRGARERENEGFQTEGNRTEREGERETVRRDGRLLVFDSLLASQVRFPSLRVFEHTHTYA